MNATKVFTEMWWRRSKTSKCFKVEVTETGLPVFHTQKQDPRDGLGWEQSCLPHIHMCTQATFLYLSFFICRFTNVHVSCSCKHASILNAWKLPDYMNALLLKAGSCCTTEHQALSLMWKILSSACEVKFHMKYNWERSDASVGLPLHLLSPPLIFDRGC